jgi:hypothetical protein
MLLVGIISSVHLACMSTRGCSGLASALKVWVFHFAAGGAGGLQGGARPGFLLAAVTAGDTAGGTAACGGYV